MTDTTTIKARLEELRTEIRAERISYGELAELQGLAPHIEPGDTELLEAAGVPEGVDPQDIEAVHALLTKLYEATADLLDKGLSDEAILSDVQSAIDGEPARSRTGGKA